VEEFAACVSPTAQNLFSS